MQINLKDMWRRIRCLANFRDNASTVELIDTGDCLDSTLTGGLS